MGDQKKRMENEQALTDEERRQLDAARKEALEGVEDPKSKPGFDSDPMESNKFR